MSSHEILENLKKAVAEYDTEGAASWARKTIEEKIDPVEAADALTDAIKEIGDAFGRGELWLPDLVGAADAMQGAMPIINEEIVKRGMERKGLGTVVVGTVYGDIHDIGKTMVSTLLIAGGFSVHDIGVNITAEEFVKAVKEHKANILALSALLSMSAPEQLKVIDSLKEEGLRDKVKIMVGGGAITEEFAKEIGADGYEATAPGAVGLARRLIGAD
ncbi:B12-binding domain-containing protein [Chloroflexota bacterium]